MKLSVVSTLYKSEPFLEQFLEETLETIKSIQINKFELIFVNDGSPDNSIELLLLKKKEIPQIKIIDLSRNFGHHYAMQSGLYHAKGELVFLIDSDLEIRPNFLKQCYNEFQNNLYLDVIYGYQEERKGKFVENIGGQFFWWLLNKFTEVKVPKNILTERLMTKKYVEALLKLGDANLFLGGMMHWVGFNQKGIPVVKGQRKGKSTYSLRKRLQLMLQAITSFSGKPLEYLFYFGCFIIVISIFIILFLLVKKIIYGNAIQLGWTSLVVLNMLILGVLSTFLGLIGMYLFKIFKQVQNRPNVIIKKIYE